MGRSAFSTNKEGWRKPTATDHCWGGRKKGRMCGVLALQSNTSQVGGATYAYKVAGDSLKHRVKSGRATHAYGRGRGKKRHCMCARLGNRGAVSSKKKKECRTKKDCRKKIKGADQSPTPADKRTAELET